ncbi:MAG: hypothetical protein K5799_07575 [Erythrobacter sp.]|nr:hypothetical protein [Erythrobacter sp.]
MEILAHRGWWQTSLEKNARVAIERALSSGYGIETDLRDCRGQIVISHDMSDSESNYELTFEQLLEICEGVPGQPMLALNIKADGLARPVAEMLAGRRVRYFVFDMSVPDTLAYIENGVTAFTRRSEYERTSPLDRKTQGLWLDAFESPYVPVSDILEAAQTGQSFAIVSPELHGKPHQEAWASWREVLAKHDSAAMLCTDLPDAAAAFFNRKS